MLSWMIFFTGFGWNYASNLHTESGSLLASTVQQIYAPGAGYALYNDEWPNGTVSFHLAHAKGVATNPASCTVIGLSL